MGAVVTGTSLLVAFLLGIIAYAAMCYHNEKEKREFLEGELDRTLNGVLLMNVYQTLAMRTAKPQRAEDALTHALLGMGSEAGELMTHWKAHLYYGKALDVDYMKKELGDCLWFLQLATGALSLTLDEVGRSNIDKLRARYPHKYSNEAALARADEGRAA